MPPQTLGIFGDVAKSIGGFAVSDGRPGGKICDRQFDRFQNRQLTRSINQIKRSPDQEFKRFSYFFSKPPTR